MKLRKLLLGGLTTTLATAPIVTNITTTNTLNNVSQMIEETFNDSSNEEAKFETTSFVNSKFTDLAKYTMVETRSYDGHGDVQNSFDGGIKFNQTISGYNGSRNGYRKPIFNEQNSTLTFDTTGHDNVYHFIAQKVKVEITVPANQERFNAYFEINGKIKTFAHGAACGNRVRHTLELFDLGDDVNNNPEFFNDTFHPNSKQDKYHVLEKQIWHKRDIAGGDTHTDTFNGSINYLLHNSTNQPITVTKYIMVAMTTNGDNNKFGDIGSTSNFEFKTSRVGESEAENEIIAYENLLEKNLQDTIKDERFDLNKFYNDVWVYIQTIGHDPSFEACKKDCRDYWIKKFKDKFDKANDSTSDIVDQIFTDKDGNKISVDDAVAKYADLILNDNQKFIRDTRESNRKLVEQFAKERKQRLLGWETLEVSSSGSNMGCEIRNNEPTMVSYDSLKEYPSHKHSEDIWGCVQSKNKIFITSDEARSARLIYVPFKVDFTIPASENTVLTYKPSLVGSFEYYSTLYAAKRPDNTFSFEMFYFGEGDQAKDLKPNKLSFAKCGNEHDEHAVWQGIYKTSHDSDGHYNKNIDISSRDLTITIDNTQGNNIHKSFYFGLAVSLDSNGDKQGLSRFDINLKPQFNRANSYIQTTVDTNKTSKANTNQEQIIDLGANAKCSQRLRENDKYKDYKLSDMNDKMSDVERKVNYDSLVTNPVAPSTIAIHCTDHGDNDGRAYYLPISIPLTVQAHTKTKFEVKLSEIIGEFAWKAVRPHTFNLETTTSLFDYGISEKLGTNEAPEKLLNYHSTKDKLSEHDKKILSYFKTHYSHVENNIGLCIFVSFLCIAIIAFCIDVAVQGFSTDRIGFAVVAFILIIIALTVLIGLAQADAKPKYKPVEEWFKGDSKPSENITEEFNKNAHYNNSVGAHFDQIFKKTIEISNTSDETKTYYLNLGYGFVHCGTEGKMNDHYCENHLYSDVQILKTEKILSE